MDIIYFTKFLAGLTVEQVGRTAADLGFDGLDLAVRAGQCVNPENVTDALPPAIASWRDMGLRVPLVTLEGGWTDPDLPALRTVYEACSDAGIPNIKLGYWHWRPQDDYWARVDEIRGALDKFEAMGRRLGLRTLVHTHSGGCYGLNASAALALVRGFDPDSVGVYLDPAHLSLNGEPQAMALAIAGDYLHMVAAKSARHLRREDGSWVVDWCLLEEGLADWRAIIQLLRGAGYDGPLSLHGEYTGDPALPGLLDRVKVDLAYLRRRLAD